MEFYRLYNDDNKRPKRKNFETGFLSVLCLPKIRIFFKKSQWSTEWNELLGCTWIPSFAPCFKRISLASQLNSETYRLQSDTSTACLQRNNVDEAEVRWTIVCRVWSVFGDSHWRSKRARAHSSFHPNTRAITPPPLLALSLQPFELFSI